MSKNEILGHKANLIIFDEIVPEWTYIEYNELIGLLSTNAKIVLTSGPDNSLYYKLEK